MIYYNDATCFTVLFFFFFNQGYVLSECCYDSGYAYCLYCSGYCSGHHGQQKCIYNGETLSIGALIGIIVGSMLFLLISACILAALCSSVNKTSRSRTSRVISPTNLYTASHSHSTHNSRGSNIPDSYRAGAESRMSVNRMGAESRASIGIPPSWGPPPSYSSLGFGNRQNPIPNAVENNSENRNIRRTESRMSIIT